MLIKTWNEKRQKRWANFLLARFLGKKKQRSSSVLLSENNTFFHPFLSLVSYLIFQVHENEYHMICSNIGSNFKNHFLPCCLFLLRLPRRSAWLSLKLKIIFLSCTFKYSHHSCHKLYMLFSTSGDPLSTLSQCENLEWGY